MTGIIMVGSAATKNQKRDMKSGIAILYLLIVLAIIEWIIGFFANVDILFLPTFAAFLLKIYFVDKRFFLKHIYMVISSLLFLAGVFVCDNATNLYMYEIEQTTGYVNALGLAVVAYMLFLSFVLAADRKLSERELFPPTATGNSDSGNRMDIASLLVWLALALEAVAACEVLIIGSNSSLGVDRYTYRSYLSGFTNTVRSNIVTVLPLLFISRGKYKKLQTALFLGLSLFILFWNGEKFGGYMALLNIAILSYIYKFDFKKIRKYVGYVILAFAVLLCVVYIQYFLLYQYTVEMFFDYLFQRMAQQGQIWWRIYDLITEQGIRFNEFFHELSTCFSMGSVTEYPYAGEWKMMYHAASFSSYVQDRIARQVPYTSSTIASIYYYFGVCGVILLYPIMGMLYSLVVYKLAYSIQRRYVVETLVLSKLYAYVVSLLFSSGLQNLLSWKTLAGLAVLFMMGVIRKGRASRKASRAVSPDETMGYGL